MNKTRILIVEDESIVAADLAAKLRQLGYEVAGTAPDGNGALELIGNLPVDLVLMDIKIEGEMDGIQTAEEINKIHDIPVIYLTAHSDTATLSRAKVTGPSGYILKPFEERELATQIELALYKHAADKEIRENREWLRVTLTSIGDAVIAVDSENNITFINPVAESLTGWTMKEAGGSPLKNVFSIINEYSREVVENPVSKVLQNGRSVALANHTALITREGKEIPIEDSAAPIKDAAGKIIGAVLVFHDVTEKRRAEEALQRSHEDLERKVSERTVELEEKNRELQEFAYIASHDMQEPLRKIRVFGEMIEKELADRHTERSRDYLFRMIRAADRMQKLLTALLSYSRVSSKASSFEEVDLKSVAEDVIRDVTTASDGLEPKIEIGDLPKIDADPFQMSQLFQNLLSNAIRYHKDNIAPVIKIMAGKLSGKGGNRNNGYCELRVADNGIGFDMDYRDRIFQPFERLHDRNKYEGTGIGLAICRKIVERHGGQITVQSETGKGTTFIIILPMKQNDEQQ